ncbi:MAG: SMC family ATPase [Mycobacterium sp.]
MRPILLELDGFASYRTKATVDFRDTDFFVLVGPTGSGKSTVIDAMVFALYGTVPRWDDLKAVAPALAPTVNRAVVRLIFDAGGKRYAATRDVRRSGGKNPTVSIKEGRLEQFVSDQALGDPEDEVVTLATGRDVNGAVEQILGLDFGQFTQSVALPQGEFAQFLHATDGERQAILKNLLGYTVYDRIQQAAFSKSTDARSRADTLAEQLEGYADATEEQVDATTRRVEQLHTLREHVTAAALPALKSAFDAANTAQSARDKAAAERGQLLAVVKPDGVDALDAQKRTATAEADAAVTAQRAIEVQDTEIRTALRALRPRHELEQVLAHWRELGDVDERLPGLAGAAGTAKASREKTAVGRDTAEAAVGLARDAADEAAAAADEYERQLGTARGHLELLKDLRAPDDIALIADALRDAAELLAAESARLTECETTQQEVASELDRLPGSGVLSLADGAAEQVLAVIAQDVDEALQRSATHTAAESARRAADSAADDLAFAEQALRAAEHANQAVVLRAGLHEGDDCPVCGQRITELPSGADEVDLGIAQASVQKARAGAQEATTEAARLENRLHKATAVREERLQRCETARSTLVKHLADLGIDGPWRALDNPVDPVTLATLAEDGATARSLIADAIGRRTATEATRREADAAVAAARDAVQTATKTLDGARQQARQAQTALHARRDTVSALDPPRIEDVDIGAAWRQLTDWAQLQSHRVDGEVQLLTPQAGEARTAADCARQQLGAAEEQAQAARTAFTDAAVAEEKANTELGAGQDRKNELLRLLADAPPAEDAGAERDKVVELEQRREDIDTQLEHARATTTRARELVDVAEAAISSSWEQLRRVRDPLASLDAPEVTGADLVAGWDRLLSWATGAADTRAAKVTAEDAALRDAQARAAAAATALADQLSRHAVEFDSAISPAELADQAPAVVAAAEATAKSAMQHARERLHQSERMRTEMQSFRDSAEVAHMLSNLMRANQFPRWLIGSALDALLQDASTILLELSGGQFELTRDERDLLVVDHNDADMPRPVKTLSGGETFQASLALALALSQQVTALSAAGASKLESIFLDEGFGTLDEATLEIVAGTLETLAASGSRMVGVITHVAALAERIPVRYQINRDSAGSHIERLQG